MDRSIKTLGLIEARIRLHPEVSVKVIVNIARSLAEAETQLITGIAVTGEIVDDDVSPAETKAASVDTAPEAETEETVLAESAPEAEAKNAESEPVAS